MHQRRGGDARVTHAILVKAARAWLQGFCRVVVTEMKTITVAEEPDAVGFKGKGESWLIECKASRADFKRDEKKISRRAGRTMGAHWLYMAPVRLIKPEELPEGWGLLEYQQSAHSRGYFLKRTVLNPISGRNYQDWVEDFVIQREEKMFLIAAAARALEAAALVKPLSMGRGKAVEALEARVAQLARERDTYDQRRRDAMQSVEQWRQRCWAVEKQLTELRQVGNSERTV